MPFDARRGRRQVGTPVLVFIVVGVLTVLLLPAAIAPAPAAAAQPRGWEARQVRNASIPARDRPLAAQLPGRAKVGYHPGTGRVRLLDFAGGRPLSGATVGVAAGDRRLTPADARSTADRFLGRYGRLFGLRDPGSELRVRSTERLAAPAALTTADGEGPANGSQGARPVVVRYAQVRDDVPVMGGEIAVQLSAQGAVLSAAGEVLPSASPVPGGARIGSAAARREAASWVSRELGRAASAVRTASEGLAWYDPRLMDDPQLAGSGVRAVWRIDARVPATASQRADRRLVLVDARAGVVLTTIGRIHTAEGPSRRICDNRAVPGRAWGCSAPFARSEGQGPTGVGDVDAAYRLMGVTYDYFFDRFGRDGVDGQGSRMLATVRYCPSHGCPWSNAEWRWGPQQAAFGQGWAKADDIVAHEFTHGILDAEAPLFYHYQSGAINESYADVFGELVDLAHPGGRDTSWTRWKIGEDTPIGYFRDMKNPGNKGHADRVRSPRWHSGPADDGGVHRNSGVGNKAAYLVASGGRFRGYRIKGIGRERTARVWYQALTTRLTPAANYVDLADALVSGCTDLVGSHGISLAHCKSVRDATRATQMNLRPARLAPATAPVCGPRTTAFDLFFDDLEDPGSGAWVAMKSVGNGRGWFWPQNPNNAPGWDGTWASSGRTNFYAPNRGSRMDSTMRMTSVVQLPPNAFLRFGHGYSFDKDARRRYDGGILEVKVDGQPWRSIGGRFTHGGYNGRIAQGYGNPLAGKRAWTGTSRGWSRTRVDLSDFAGSRLKVRFRMASDRKVGARGWYIDDVRIYTCANDRGRPTGSLRIDEGAATTADARVRLGLAWNDAATWVTHVRLSGSAARNGKGRLRQGINMPVRATVAWDLADTTFGGSGKRGTRRVFAQVRDVAGNWSAVFSDAIEWTGP